MVEIVTHGLNYLGFNEFFDEIKIFRPFFTCFSASNLNVVESFIALIFIFVKKHCVPYNTDISNF